MDLTLFLRTNHVISGSSCRCSVPSTSELVFLCVFFRPSGDFLTFGGDSFGRDASECAPQSSCTALKLIMQRFSLPFKGGSDLVAKFESRGIPWRLEVLDIHHLKCLSMFVSLVCVCVTTFFTNIRPNHDPSLVGGHGLLP